MPMGLQDFQLVLAAVMAGGLFIFVLPLVRLAVHAQLPRLSVVLILVPLVGVVWLCLVAMAMTRARRAGHGA